MAITFDKDKGIFKLRAGSSDYVIKLAWGDLVHLYWGKAVTDADLSPFIRQAIRVYSPDTHPGEFVSYDFLPLEYPFYGTGDFRQPAFQVQTSDGYRLAEPKYQGHSITKGKPALDGLPATYVENADEAETLVIDMFDPLIGLRVLLSYTAFERYNAVARSVKFINESASNIKLLRALSFSLDFMNCDFEMLQLSGSWGRERHIHKRPLVPGTQSIESRRGVSSHQQNPFIALLKKDSTEDTGDVHGFSLVYSGSFLGSVEVDQYDYTRVAMGINPFDFGWTLEPGEKFQTPEAVLVYSDSGLTGMSQTYHELYSKRLCRGFYRDRERPVCINNWEATYFAFNEEQLLGIAKDFKELGAEIFVVDDGWFGQRNDDSSSLGDWFVNKEKLPGGLKSLGEKVLSLGMEFGVWVEPEMISKNSELYRAHPDWCIHAPGRRQTESRNQLVLDLSRADVCEYVINVLSDVFSSAPITYVKWDMNRSLTEIGSSLATPERQIETAHRFVLGLYGILDTLTAKFPHILFESCASGGGRTDPGMLAYMPQTWISDDTDAFERIKIQHGTSIVYPPISIEVHVSASPNHQIHRMTPVMTRLHAGMAGNFGFEIDASKLTSQERELIKTNIALYKEIRPIVQFGRFYRILSPFEGNETAWIYVTEDKAKAVLFYFKKTAGAHEPFKILKLKGLDQAKNYTLVGLNQSFSGDTLMNAGINTPGVIGDFGSSMIRLYSE
ncbi:MAG TPA: alpha-galactosidase [Desulfomonilia bacterium]